MADLTNKRAPKKQGPIQKLHPKADAFRAWFFGGSTGAALLWAACVLVLAAIVVAFFAISPYGTPAGPIYAEF